MPFVNPIILIIDFHDDVKKYFIDGDSSHKYFLSEMLNAQKKTCHIEIGSRTAVLHKGLIGFWRNSMSVNFRN